MAHSSSLLPKPGKWKNEGDAAVAVENLGVSVAPGGTLEHKPDGSFVVHDTPEEEAKQDKERKAQQAAAAAEKKEAPAATTTAAKEPEKEDESTTSSTHYGAKKK